MQIMIIARIYIVNNQLIITSVGSVQLALISAAVNKYLHSLEINAFVNGSQQNEIYFDKKSTNNSLHFSFQMTSWCLEFFFFNKLDLYVFIVPKSFPFGNQFRISSNNLIQHNYNSIWADNLTCVELDNNIGFFKFLALYFDCSPLTVTNIWWDLIKN
jgi:hypothetical protein